MKLKNVIIIFIIFLVSILIFKYNETSKIFCDFSNIKEDKNYFLRVNKSLNKEGIKLFYYGDNNYNIKYEVKTSEQVFESLLHILEQIRSDEIKTITKKEKIALTKR